ncbi:hypothetical protein HNQ07_004390 [Deinococcus metalli]|uniref:DUF4198 domain-containing protein n=1 Tax=Deinococcus metalli TaxID=1141878 RepID=A0A7W8KJD9_9DEIO|nr:hypothetical protein [Deinococcus metalli]MBB5378883.1 hypothetical protein [Deinococcus metalli]GHF62409.1 hypothetical protein GCM10017781_43120 [Deinococcus metalli]
MRHIPSTSAVSAALLGLLALSAPAHAWVPKLEETTAKNVIDGVYARRDPVVTFLTVDLSVKNGAFASGPAAVTAFDGGASCVSDWLAEPPVPGKGSRPRTITLSGQADELAFQAQDARNKFQNLSVADALGPDLTAARLADGDLRVDIAVAGLPSQQARGAYLVRLKGPDGKLIAPERTSYVNDFKQDAGGWSGTLVYYFQPLKAGIGASDKTELLLRTEADTACAYSIPLDLGAFQ